MNRRIGLTAGLALVALAFSASAMAAPKTASASGQGTLDQGKRTFSFNAKLNADGSASGQANLVSRNFTGANGNSPYHLQIDVSCMKVVGNIAFVGGIVTNTNDTGGGVYTGAVYFSVQDNGEPGKGGVDKISRVAFFDADPDTVGDPQLCQFATNVDLPLEPIENGNIQVR
jgi:hypothetical protein